VPSDSKPYSIHRFLEYKKDDYKIKITPVSAEQIHSFVEMSAFVLKGLLNDEQYKLWLKLLNLDTMFATKESY